MPKPLPDRLCDPADTLFISDLDGTLLGTNRALPAFTRRSLEYFLRRDDIHLTFATARELYSAQSVLGDLKLPLPIITANGAFVQDYQTGRKLINFHFTDEEEAILAEAIARYPVKPLVYSTQENGLDKIVWIRGGESEGTLYYLNQRQDDPRHMPLEPEQIDQLYRGDVFCINIMDDHDRLLPLYEELAALDRFMIIFHQELYRPEWWLSLYPKVVSKGAAAIALQRQLGLKHLVVFGDASNDLSMFAVADEAYAVANADERLKAEATDVLPRTNDESAVPLFLLERFEVMQVEDET